MAIDAAGTWRPLRARAVLAALAAGLALTAGSTEVLAGPGTGPFRYFANHGFFSVELAHRTGFHGLGAWASLDLSAPGKYLGLGPRVDLPLGTWGEVGVSSGPGWYSDNRGLDLGSKLEFRSTVYLMARPGRRLWAGVSFSHYSNAGLSEHNPGAETVRVLIGVPLGPGDRP